MHEDVSSIRNGDFPLKVLVDSRASFLVFMVPTRNHHHFDKDWLLFFTTNHSYPVYPYFWHVGKAFMRVIS